MQMTKNDDIICGFTKTVQHSRISLEILKQFSSNLVPEMYMKNEKWHPSCSCHDNSYATGPVLIKAKSQILS